MCASLWALLLLPVVAVALALPPVSAAVGHVQPIVLDLDAPNAQATFSVPCQACLGRDDDESFLFDFQVFPSEQPCGNSNITLNGQQLIQNWHGIRADGAGSISSSSRATGDDEPEHHLDLSWETSCLFDTRPDFDESENGKDVAQLLTVTIKRVDDRPVEGSAGFTVSFKQLARQAELLRLATHPTPAVAGGEAEDWRDPPAELRLVSVDFNDLPEGFFRQGSSLEDEIELLRMLEAEEKEIQERILHQKKIIQAHMRDNAHSLKEELQTCDNLSCLFKAFLHKAHGAVQIIYIHLRPGHPHRHHHNMDDDPFGTPYHGRPEQDFAEVREGSAHGPHGHHPIMKIGAHPQGPPPFDGPEGHGPEGHGPPLGHPPGHPPFDGPLDHGPPPPDQPHGQSHGQPHFGGPNGHGPPPPRGPHHHHRGPRPLHAILMTFASLSCLACIFSFIRRYCCSLRQRTERRAAREERRTARQYRRLARRHAWRNWWYGTKDDLERRADYEEKRALILEQEDRLEEAMQEEIRQLRCAHELAHDIVRAEEGRIMSCSPSPSTCHCSHANPHMHAQSQPYPHLPHPQPHAVPRANGLYTPSPMSRTTSLPSYKSDTASIDTDDAPPAYEEDADSSDIVVDGFREYTTSVTTAYTPESSIPDGSPRPSAETMREMLEPETESIGLDRDRKN